MPTLKARVFSNHSEEAAGLAEALRRQGYLVEVLRPGQISGSPADLEIVLETCNSADMVGRATHLAELHDADVAVTPGTLNLASLPAMEEPVPQEVEPEPDVASRLILALRSQPEPIAAVAEEEESETVKPAGAVPGFWARAIPATAVALTAGATTARQAFVSARDQAREYKERAMTAMARAQAEREEHLLVLTQRRIEAQEQAQKLAKARKNAVEYLRQLRRESGGVIQPAAENTARKDSPEPVTRPWDGLIEKFRDRLRPLRWDAALAGLASAGALFAIGLAVASFNSKPATTAGADQPSAAISNPTPANAPQPSPTKAAARPSPAVHARAVKPSPAQHSRPARHQETANDVVVRHLASPTPTPKVQAQGWKHFSDMDH